MWCLTKWNILWNSLWYGLMIPCITLLTVVTKVQISNWYQKPHTLPSQAWYQVIIVSFCRKLTTSSWNLMLLDSTQQWYILTQKEYCNCPDSKVHGASMVPTWVLSAPDGPHVGSMNLAFRVLPCKGGLYVIYPGCVCSGIQKQYHCSASLPATTDGIVRPAAGNANRT